MVYNNVTNALRNWCADMTERYSNECEQERANTGESLKFISSHVTAELHYKLGTLIDKDFWDYDAYLKSVFDLMAIHIDFILKKDFDAIEYCHVQNAENAFQDYVKSLSPTCADPASDYCRIIWDDEADDIANSIFKAWGYDSTYWYPLTGKYDENKLFIAPKWIEPHMDEIRSLIGIPQNHIYNYGEEWYDRAHCAEVNYFENDAKSESAYVSKDFSWIIYYSHENTVTFAGTIVPQIKKILLKEQAHWNRFDLDY